MSYPTLYFGVELEFLIGYLMPGEPLKDSTATRVTQFKPDEAMVREVGLYSISEELTADKLFNNDGRVCISVRNTVNTMHSIFPLLRAVRIDKYVASWN